MEGHHGRQRKKKRRGKLVGAKGKIANGKNGQKRNINLQIKVCLLSGLGAKIPMFGTKENEDK